MTESFEEFQEFRKILCLCPCCGELVRVSDLHLKTKGSSVKTWLDDYEKHSFILGKKEESFEEKEARLREIAREKGRKGAEKVFENIMNKTITPEIKALKLNPFDIKAILNPIDFVVFNGMTKKGLVDNIIFLSKQCKNKELNCIRSQVEKAINGKNYEWQVARIDNEGNIKFEE